MRALPPPDEVERSDPLSFDVMLDLLRRWRNHWVAVERAYDDFPVAVQQLVRSRPSDMAEALQELVPQHAVRVHPDAASSFVAYLNAVIRTLEQGSRPNGDPELVDRNAASEMGVGLADRVAALEDGADALQKDLRKAR